MEYAWSYYIGGSFIRTYSCNYKRFKKLDVLLANFSHCFIPYCNSIQKWYKKLEFSEKSNKEKVSKQRKN